MMPFAIVIRAIGHVGVAVLKVALFAPFWNEAQRKKETARWARRVLAIFGIALNLRGAVGRTSGQGVLLAANHVSWLDIIVLMACANIRFVAKSEVRDWPVAGWLAARLGTQFIDRNRRSAAHAATCAVESLLDAGYHVCIFPEGTTTDGRSLRRFRGALFESAAHGKASVQPIALRFRGSDGRPSDATAFTGKTSLAASVWRLSHATGLVCECDCLAVFDTHDQSRRDLAMRTQSAIAAHLEVGVIAEISAIERPQPAIALVAEAG